MKKMLTIAALSVILTGCAQTTPYPTPIPLSVQDVGPFNLRVSQTSYGFIVSANGPRAHVDRALSRRYVLRAGNQLRCEDGRRPRPSSNFVYGNDNHGRYSQHYRCD